MASLKSSSIILVSTFLGFAVAATTPSPGNYEHEKVPAYWQDLAHDELEFSLRDRQLGVAKNVILFLGDGMGPTTVTGARILAGQLLGKKGEEHKLSFDKFPYTGQSRTYNTNTQTTDSAASATAFLCGVKTNQGMLGLNAAASRGSCSSASGAQIKSILRWSESAGKSTGVVTTTRITHATPAASYAHCPDRDWESDRHVPASEKNCEDIALQLITHNKDIQVIMGGGRTAFYPANFVDPHGDPSYNTTEMSRTDGRNLVEEWKKDKQDRGLSHKFVYDVTGLNEVEARGTDYLLGLFNQDHMTYDIDRDAKKEPSLAEMVEKAIGILSKNEEGFFLLVEGGRIDHAHHKSLPSKSFHEVIAFAKAVEKATQLTSQSDTLIVVTADHSHVMGIAGYASRGNPILGISDLYQNPGVINVGRPTDNLPYTTIVYGNGPGYTSPRQNLTNINTEDKEYVSQSAVPMDSETHGGEDVAIYAIGPQSFLYTGVHEQNYIPMVMAYASCVGPYAEGQRPCAKYQKTWSHQTDGQGTNTDSGGRWLSVGSVILTSILVLWNCLF